MAHKKVHQLEGGIVLPVNYLQITVQLYTQLMERAKKARKDSNRNGGKRRANLRHTRPPYLLKQPAVDSAFYHPNFLCPIEILQ